MGIEDYIDGITNPMLQSWGVALHHCILAVLPQVEACIKFKTPFYVYRRWVCLLGDNKSEPLGIRLYAGLRMLE